MKTSCLQNNLSIIDTKGYAETLDGGLSCGEIPYGEIPYGEIPYGEIPYGEPLRTFVELADTLRVNVGSVQSTGANKRLIDSVLQLEICLGTSLLEKRGKSYSLSTSGCLLLEYARKMYSAHDSPKKPDSNGSRDRQRKLHVSQTDEVANKLVFNTMNFVGSLVHADASLFFWIGAGGEMIDFQSKGVNLDCLDFYEQDVGRYDPLHITRLCADSKHIASLSYSRQEGVEIPPHYGRHLVEIDVGDEVDLVFWKHGRPLACMAFLRKVKRVPFSLDEVDWTALYSHTEDFLNMHWRFRSEHIEVVLVDTFNLTPRELDVVEWLIGGKSNWDIARILSISESTVKVHAASVLKKLGVESRSAASAMVSGL